jgi:cytochrome P450
LVPRKTFRSGLKLINEFVNPFIERTLRLSPDELVTQTKSESGYTFLHALASFTRDRKILRDQLVAVLLAGRDTTASTLSWTFYELAKHPEAWKALRKEVLETVGRDKIPTYDDLKGMKYLQHVMNETLRIYPVVPFNVRVAFKDTTLPRGGGPDGLSPFGILAGTPIAYSPLVMQRRQDIYPPSFASDPTLDAEYFKPERWENWQPRPWTYIPFNGGPRICIGQQFALTEMGYTIVRLCQRFAGLEFRMPEGLKGSPVLKAEIVLQPGDGVRVGFYDDVKA